MLFSELICEISGSNGDENEDDSRLGYSGHPDDLGSKHL
jgi:hypothetical protein